MRIDIKGDIVINEYKEFYDWLGWDCVCPMDVHDAISKASDDEIIDVYINSPGGHVTAGQEIYSTLRANKQVRVHIDGMACSAASIIAMSGQSDMSPVAMLMIHNVSGGASGDYHDMEHARQELKTMNEALAAAYVEKTGMSLDDVLKMMDKETWLTANQCVQYGFINAISTPAVAQNYAFNAVNSGIKLTDELMQKVKSEMKAKDTTEKLKNSLLEDLDMYGV